MGVASIHTHDRKADALEFVPLARSSIFSGGQPGGTDRIRNGRLPIRSGIGKLRPSVYGNPRKKATGIYARLDLSEPQLQTAGGLPPAELPNLPPFRRLAACSAG